MNAVLADPALPEWVRNWTGRRDRREFIRQEYGLRYCVNASVFGPDVALVVMAQDLKLAPRRSSLRASDLSHAARSAAIQFAWLAERHICPDWRATEFAMVSPDRERPTLHCGTEVGTK